MPIIKKTHNPYQANSFINAEALLQFVGSQAEISPQTRVNLGQHPGISFNRSWSIELIIGVSQADINEAATDVPATWNLIMDNIISPHGVGIGITLAKTTGSVFRLRCAFANGSAENLYSIPIPDTPGLYHTVVTFDGATKESNIFVNGIASDPLVVTTDFSVTNDFFLGDRPSDPNTRSWKGQIGLVRFYSETFTQQDVIKLLQAPYVVSSELDLHITAEYIPQRSYFKDTNNLYGFGPGTLLWFDSSEQYNYSKTVFSLDSFTPNAGGITVNNGQIDHDGTAAGTREVTADITPAGPDGTFYKVTFNIISNNGTFWVYIGGLASQDKRIPVTQTSGNITLLVEKEGSNKLVFSNTDGAILNNSDVWSINNIELYDAAYVIVPRHGTMTGWSDEELSLSIRGFYDKDSGLNSTGIKFSGTENASQAPLTSNVILPGAGFTVMLDIDVDGAPQQHILDSFLNISSPTLRIGQHANGVNVKIALGTDFNNLAQVLFSGVFQGSDNRGKRVMIFIDVIGDDPNNWTAEIDGLNYPNSTIQVDTLSGTSPTSYTLDRLMIGDTFNGAIANLDGMIHRITLFHPLTDQEKRTIRMNSSFPDSKIIEDINPGLGNTIYTNNGNSLAISNMDNIEFFDRDSRTPAILNALKFNNSPTYDYLDNAAVDVPISGLGGEIFILARIDHSNQPVGTETILMASYKDPVTGTSGLFSFQYRKDSEAVGTLRWVYRNGAAVKVLQPAIPDVYVNDGVFHLYRVVVSENPSSPGDDLVHFYVDNNLIATQGVGGRFWEITGSERTDHAFGIMGTSVSAATHRTIGDFIYAGILNERYLDEIDVVKMLNNMNYRIPPNVIIKCDHLWQADVFSIYTSVGGVALSLAGSIYADQLQDLNTIRSGSSNPGYINAETLLEFDASENLHNSAFLIDATHVMNFWDGIENGTSRCQIFGIDAATGVVTPLGTPSAFGMSSGLFSSAFLVDTTHVMNFWQDYASLCQLFEIDTTTGVVAPMGSPLQFAVNEAGEEWHSAFLIDATHVMNFWEGTNYAATTDRGGFCQLFEVDTGTGNVIPMGTALEFGLEHASDNSAFLIDATHVMSFWTGEANSSGFCRVFEISTATGTVTPLGIALEFDANAGVDNHSAFLIDTTRVMNFWRGSGGMIGFCQLFEINTVTGAITPMGVPFQFDNRTRTAGYNTLIKAFLVDATHVMAFWSTDEGGFAQLFEIDTGTGNITPVGNPVVYDAFSSENSPFVLNASHVINFWRGGSTADENDGYCRVFEIAP